jgi:hypothetical protein
MTVQWALAHELDHLLANNDFPYDGFLTPNTTEAGPHRLFVDPRPLPPDSQLFEMTRGSFVRAAPEVLRAREAALREMQVEPGDAVALGRSAGVPGHSRLP